MTDREYGPQIGRARKDKYLRHGTKVRMRGQLLGDAELKDARYSLLLNSIIKYYSDDSNLSKRLADGYDVHAIDSLGPNESGLKVVHWARMKVAGRSCGTQRENSRCYSLGSHNVS